ncbi:tetratricopeptide repeat protein [Staphylococcus massiliensis]|uniref:TPR-repeat-containing protein n=1 Tax=Staphylococcus massiliensis S46 TaxID=1229783 RepID=K9B102_9STAP|nr:tetratricopeptide repeat protein [Staphylococcus massiliensis]EKU47460.1 hypothetical protein C273_07177 [Staphylococcus massiliensis S46]MCG3401100.1 tetratricopeptide repeat protein [Staphylococcus massiliensis]MCG3412236.1 tetratricopeptide repeat protein [Staphylococcus massiliensis]POA01125.1 hypothetical protein CD133_02605 [Staphylococcus massiliensis CCUG 55927]
MEDIHKIIDDINLQNLKGIDSRVENALTEEQDEGALFILGETLYQYGLIPQGLEVFRFLYHKFPNEPELLIYFVEGLIAEGETDEALEYLTEVEDTPEKLMLEADLYQQLNMLEVAIEKLNQAKMIQPEDPIINFALAELFYYDGQWLRAVTEYDTVLETGDYMINGVNLFSRIADCSLQSGNYADAIQNYDEISDSEMTSEDYFKKAISYEKNERTKEAISIMKDLLTKDPDFIQGYFYLQQLYELEKDYPSAIEIGNEGLKLNQFYKELMCQTGSLEIEHGDQNDGVDHLLESLEVDPSYHEPVLILSEFYREQDDHEALIGLIKYVDEEDMDPVFMWHLAYAYGEEERDKEAMHFYQLAYQTLNDQAPFLSDYYFYLIEIGHIEEAKPILQKLKEIDATNETWFEEEDRLQ